MSRSDNQPEGSALDTDEQNGFTAPSPPRSDFVPQPDSGAQLKAWRERHAAGLALADDHLAGFTAQLDQLRTALASGAEPAVVLPVLERLTLSLGMIAYVAGELAR